MRFRARAHIFIARAAFRVEHQGTTDASRAAHRCSLQELAHSMRSSVVDRLAARCANRSSVIERR
ncbi:MAG TPA: hypothetical protein VJQ46_10395 [Gemmatimonadales bacterium]|nr:hypothetical protein [Gemmatimonadales bacterium]